MRCRLLVLMSLFVLLGAPSVARASEVLSAIDEAHRAGEIDRAERLLYRVTAVRAPERLPARWRQLHQRGVLQARSHTTVLVEAVQRLAELPPEQRDDIEDLLLPPTDLLYTVESQAPFPMRVSYADPSLQDKAERVLAAAETSYALEVEQWGFWEPPIEPGAEAYRFYVQNAAGAAGYTSPYASVPDTPQADSYSYIVIDPTLDDIMLETTVAHEFNHACQIAMDVAEQRSFMENSASYIEALVFPAGWPYTAMTFPYFQGHPYRPVEYMKGFSSDYYEYGGALWALFLTQRYGDDDPRWLRQVWEGSVQNGYTNEPDYFDALDEMIPDEGGAAGAARQFGEDRFFIGTDADGQHLTDAHLWGGGEVWRTATYSASVLPVRDQGPRSAASRPQPNGCNYVVVAVDESSALPLRVSFDGQATVPWDVRLMKVASGQDTVVETLELDAEAVAIASLDMAGLDQVVMVICQSSVADYDPDDHQWPAGDYRYSLEYDIPPPTVLQVSPAEVERGAHGLELEITGTNFVDHEDLSVFIDGGRVATELLEVVSAEMLRVEVTVAPSAELGARDVKVTNPGGAAGVGEGLLTVVEPEVDEVAVVPQSLEPDGGCSCRASGHRGASGWLAAGLLVVLGLGRRQRAGSSQPRARRGQGRSRLRGRWATLAVVAALLGWARPALADPPPSVGFVESNLYPIRVHYSASAGEAAALEVLSYAEPSWYRQVEQMGFTPPSTVDENGDVVPEMWIYVDPDAIGDHADPIGDNPLTPWTDCTVRLIVRTLTPASYLEVVTAHEMNHALQMASDCGEASFAYENTTVAVTTLMWPDDTVFRDYMLPAFQQHPYHGLPCTFRSSQDKIYYHYGASLFHLFLEDAYGSYDGTLLSSIWEAARQDGAVVSAGGMGVILDVPNDPHLLDAIDTVLGETTIEDALVEFARWRYFVGQRDDGAHFRDGALWSGGEVAMDTTLTLEELPLVQALPVNPPNDYGTVYLELSLFDMDPERGLAFNFAGDPAMRWNIDALLIAEDLSATVQSLSIAEGGAGELLLDQLDGATHVVFAITNLATEDYDALLADCVNGRMFSYDLSVVDLASPPEISGCEPDELQVGGGHYLWVSGSDFTEVPTLSLSGEGIDLLAVDYVDPTIVGVELWVAADAPLGPRDLTLVNPNGAAHTLSAAVTVVAPAVAEQPSSSDDGCGCAAPGRRDGPPGLWLALLALVGLLRRRR